MARTIGKAFSKVFFSATLTRATVAYPCKGLIEKDQRYFGGAGLGAVSRYRVLVLATTLSVEPLEGDVLAIQGKSLTIMPATAAMAAVEIDPAGAVWVLNCLPSDLLGEIGTGTGGLAEALGEPFDIYRPSGLSNPLAFVNKRDTCKAAFTSGSSQGYNFQKAPGYSEALWSTLIDPSGLQQGDFLHASDMTYFIAAMEPLLPVLSVRCNQVVKIERPTGANTGTGGAAASDLVSQVGGTRPYLGQSVASDGGGSGFMELATDCPIYMNAKAGRATGSRNSLPADAPGPSIWTIYASASEFPRDSIQDHDVMIDEDGYRYYVSLTEWTRLGFRMSAIRLET